MIETCYDKSVSGLSVGSTVNLRGVKLGEVKEISFVGNDYSNVPVADAAKIRVVMAIRKKLIGPSDDGDAHDEDIIRGFVKRGLRATVTASGITGLSRVELDYHPDAQPYAKLAWTPAHAFVPPKESLLESFSVSATKILNQIDKMDLTATWSNLSVAVEALRHASDSARTMIEARQADLDSLMSVATETSASARDLVNELKRNPSLLVRERTVVPLAETER